ncbi:MAG: putative 2OG-Fe(II) oxygenase [Bacteriovoracaceae bacterium]
MDVLNYFGPPLVKLRGEELVVNELNDYMDKVLLHTEKKQPFFAHWIKPGFLESVEKYVLKLGSEFHQTFAKDSSTTLTIESMYIVSQRRGVWNNLHHHTGDIAGILYLRIPKVLWDMPYPEDTSGFNPGGIAFALGTPGPYHKTLCNVNPKDGELYLFPANVLHTVYPFESDEERRCFVFNLNRQK